MYIVSLLQDDPLNVGHFCLKIYGACVADDSSMLIKCIHTMYRSCFVPWEALVIMHRKIPA